MLCARRVLLAAPTRIYSSPACRAHSWPARRVSEPYHGPLPDRTHDCRSLSAETADQHVVLSGWLLDERKINRNFSFFNLRDSAGTVQLLASSKIQEGPTAPQPVLPDLAQVTVETPVVIKGQVRLRPASQRKPDQALGDIEIFVEDFIVLNPADRELPFQPHAEWDSPKEELRARYRYLDLRRPSMTENLRKRSKTAHVIRNALHDQGFIEVETPVLLRSSSEGAREFLVPTRISASPDGPEPLFWALQQSPQQPKQLLMCSGAVEKYFQIARCFRDEDGRKDRQPEFTQVDLEMAFISWGPPGALRPPAAKTERERARAAPRTPSRNSENWRIGGHQVRDVIEDLVRRIWGEVAGVQLAGTPFRVMTYNRAMTRYGSDKPDLRYGLKLADVTALLPTAIRSMLQDAGEAVECLVMNAEAPADRPFVRADEQLAGTSFDGAERVVVSEANRDDWFSKSSLMQPFISSGQLSLQDMSELNVKLKLQAGGTVWLARRSATPEGGSTPLGKVRVGLSDKAQELGDFVPPAEPHFLWVTEFPLFTRADEDKEFLAHGRWSSSHHPFTAPMLEDIEAMYAGRIAEVRGQHYDLVLNGMEIGGGSVRVHDAAMQEHIFTQILQLSDKEKSAFDHLLHALKCGAPPHGGIALGFDRLMSILCGTNSIRDVIAFPKTSASTDPLFKSPAAADSEILRGYGLTPLHKIK